jgi:hypothetical protein
MHCDLYMKKLFLFMFAVVAIFANISANAENTYRPKSAHSYITGPRGGCYYINRNGSRTYVDRALCKAPVTKTKKPQATKG